MRKLILNLLAVLCVHISLAQSGKIKGTIGDTTERKALPNAVVSILRPKDSVLISFTRTKDNGEFFLNHVKPGSYLLMITYPKFADYVDQVMVTENADLSLAKINLIRKSELLKEVVVTQKLGAIRIKGDTMAFMADSFKVKEGANVEELLKKMPGIQINKNGEITAQGERVQKVLVDGEEFFSDDPAVVTQNLRADAVKEVQVFDKKSDQATFTGIDDGEKQKTINLKLKDDKKKGYFGKAKIAGGTPGNFENDGMLNAFRGKRKFSAFGTMSNTGKAGLNWEDQERFGGGSNMQYNEEEGYFFSFNEGDEFNTWGGRYNGEGLPVAWTGGVHFSNKWNSDRNNLNLNYKYNKINLGVEGTTLTQAISDTQFFSRQTRNTYNQNIRNQFNGFYDVAIDSFTSIKFTIAGSKTKGRSDAHYTSLTSNEFDRKVNDNIRNLTSVGDKQALNSNLIFRKKFRKVGRTISFSADQSYTDNETNGLLQATTNFFDPANGALLRSEIIDQKKQNKTNAFSLNTRLAYTEPLSKTTFVEVNVGYRTTNSEALRNSFNKDGSADPKYTQRDSLYSNDYDFDVDTKTAGLNLRVNKKKFSYSFGSNFAFADFIQTDLGKDSMYSYNFVNLFPRASLRYNLGPQSRININYNGSTRQPSLEQLQPIRENTDPLNIQVGNANLKQEFRHNVSFNYNNYKVLTSRNMWLSGNVSFVDDAISTSSLLENGKRTTQYVNVDGNKSASVWLGYWFQKKKWRMNFGANGGVSASQFNNFLNGEQNRNDNRSANIYFNINHDKEKKYSISLRPQISYNFSRSSLRPEAVTKYWTSESQLDINVQLPWKMEINTDATFSIRQRTEVFPDDLNTTRWNAYLGKKFWKNNAGEIRMSVFDILDQNIGFQRNASSNFVTENRYNTIRRYWLLSFIWNFTHNPATAGVAK